MNAANLCSKNEIWQGQQKRVFEALSRAPKTRLQVSKETSTPIQNVCRYIASFRRLGKVVVLRTDTCPVSKMKAEFLSTDPHLIRGRQMNMFDHPRHERISIATLT